MLTHELGFPGVPQVTQMEEEQRYVQETSAHACLWSTKNERDYLWRIYKIRKYNKGDRSKGNPMFKRGGRNYKWIKWSENLMENPGSTRSGMKVIRGQGNGQSVRKDRRGATWSKSTRQLGWGSQESCAVLCMGRMSSRTGETLWTDIKTPVLGSWQWIKKIFQYRFNFERAVYSTEIKE